MWWIVGWLAMSLAVLVLWVVVLTPRRRQGGN